MLTFRPYRGPSMAVGHEGDLESRSLVDYRLSQLSEHYRRLQQLERHTVSVPLRTS